MAYITFAEYQTYTGTTLETAEATLLTASIIPEAEKLIEETVGYSFAVSAATAKNHDAVKDTSGLTLFFKSFIANNNPTIKLNGSTISSTDYVLLGEGPYYGAELLASSGLSWSDYGDDPQGAIEVTAYWGYSQTPPVLIKKACFLYCQDELKNRLGTAVDLQPFRMFRILNMFPRFRPFGIG